MRDVAPNQATRRTEAERRALDGKWLYRVRIALRSGIALALNPTDTEQVLVFSTAIDGARLLRVRQELETSPEGLQLLRSQPAIDSLAVDGASLRSLPSGSLGAAYVAFLDAKGLTSELFEHAPGLPPDLAYVGKRIRQTHVLTGLNIDVPGEVALQAFTYAQLKLGFSLAIVIFGCMFYGLRYPHMLGMAYRWYRVGVSARRLLPVHWERLWGESVEDLRARCGISSP
jgi:ubiquinone biosynthesis protein COQ4